MHKGKAQFVDEYFNVHEMSTELGRGGQGVVFRTRDPNVAVKLALDGTGRPVTHSRFVEKLRRVRMMPVPQDLHLAGPSAVLQGVAGYAMRLLDDMVPFRHFWPDRTEYSSDDSLKLPDWLAGMDPSLAFNILSYRDTGSLRRRLLALYKCSAILARLHGAGMVYGDVSFANAFVSRNMESRDVWLIDADNLRFEAIGKGPGIYTPGFGAPELVQGLDGGRQRTDCHAFAVMAFWMLTQQHPFIGDYVEEGGDDDWANDDTTEQNLDEKAFAGLLPWIHDEDDDSNSTENGMPRPLVLTDQLMRLFQETFGPGRVRSWRRPAIFHWPPALAQALDQTVSCPQCSMSYYDENRSDDQRCPYCDTERPRLLRVVSYDWNGCSVKKSTPAWTFVGIWQPEATATIRLPHRIFYPFSVAEGDRDVLEISELSGELSLRCCDVDHGHRLAVGCGQMGGDAFRDFAERAALSLAEATRGFWLRVGGGRPRVLRCWLDGSTR